MRRFFRPILFAMAAATACALGDDLDTLLTQPPSASLTTDDAERRIEMLRAFTASQPERAAEIEAYLIPFVRVTEPPPAPATPAPTPPPAKPKPLLLVKSADGTASTMRALSYRKQGAVIIAAGEGNSRALFQAGAVVGALPWYREAEIESGAVNLDDLATRYETSARVVPTLAGELRREAARLRGIARAKREVAERERAAMEARVSQVTAPAYDATSGYTPAALAALLLDAEKVRRELPQFSERIDAWGVPFREHFARLLSGFSRVDGQWISNAELAKRAHEKQQQEFLRGLDYRVGSEALPADAVGKLVAPFVTKGCLAIAAGCLVLVLGRRWPWAYAAGAALVAFAPLAMATMFFLATRDPGHTPLKIPADDERQVVAALSQAAGLPSLVAGPHRISEAGLNGFLARHVRIERPTLATESPGREALALRLLPGRILVFEMVRSMGLDWIVRFDLAFRRDGDGSALVFEGAKVGALDCPQPLATELWNNLEPQLARILAAGGVARHFAIQPPIAGAIELEPAPKAAE